MSALANAAAGGHWAAARLLVERGADPDDAGWVDGDGAPQNLLEAAVARGDDAFAEALVEAGASVDTGALRAAAARGAAGVVRALLAAGADPQPADGDGADAVFAAAAEGHADVLALVLAAGSPDAADADGTSCLAAAAVRGHVEVVELLLKRGAAPDAQNVDGHTALMFAQNGRAQVAALRVKYLASVPAAASAPDANLGAIDAARAAHERCVQLLLAYGADAKKADRDGRIAADFAPRELAAA
jgi:ankyrin repeat protein